MGIGPRRRRNLWIALFAVFFALTTMSAGDAEARRKRRKRKKKAAAAKINVRALGELMGPFKFGMSKEQVLKILAKQIAERYKEKIAATTDVYEQDKLRRARKKEIARIKRSYTEFTGKKTGWDVSIIDDQFAHNTSESMMVFWENEPGSGKDQRRFFFFHDGRLYKMFIALNSSMLKDQQRSFAYFQNLMERRYGPGKVEFKTDRKGVESPVAIDWHTRKYHVKAIDKLSFYGSFVLVIGDPDTEALVAEARDANRKPKKSNAILDAVVADDDDELPSLESGKAAVESITNQ